MFLGEFTTSVTAGDRVAVPKNLRRQLGKDSLVLTRGYEGCIVLVTKDDFEKLLDGVADRPFISIDKREVSRFLLGSAHETKADSQGRIIIPDSLRKHAGINKSKEAVFLGVGNWIEIWNVKSWKAYQKKSDKKSIEIANRLSKLEEGK